VEIVGNIFFVQGLVLKRDGPDEENQMEFLAEKLVFAGIV